VSERRYFERLCIFENGRISTYLLVGKKPEKSQGGRYPRIL
jgi:hypothetical protein